MTLWGFLATLLICATVITVAVLFTRKYDSFEFEIGPPEPKEPEAKSGE